MDVRCETKTRDNVFVTVIVSVQYQASNIGVLAGVYAYVAAVDSPSLTPFCACVGGEGGFV